MYEHQFSHVKRDVKTLLEKHLLRDGNNLNYFMTIIEYSPGTYKDCAAPILYLIK